MSLLYLNKEQVLCHGGRHLVSTGAQNEQTKPFCASDSNQLINIIVGCLTKEL